MFVNADTANQSNQCSHHTKVGEQCKKKRVPGEAVCAWHLPANQPSRRLAAQQGGRARSNAVRALKATSHVPATTEPKTTVEILGRIDAAMDGVLAGTIDPNVARALSDLAKTRVIVSQALTVENLEQQVRELQAEVDEVP